MTRNFIAAFAAPAIAALGVGVSAALASGAGWTERLAYGDPAERLTSERAAIHAETIFARADLDRSGALDANEYVSLAIVTAELARLNGFVALEIGDAAEIVSVPITPPSAMSSAERIRVEAVARNEFYAAAGDDGLMSVEEFLGEQAARFEAADRNRNGALGKSELVNFASRAAFVSEAGA